jgi:hypothetical protein
VRWVVFLDHLETGAAVLGDLVDVGALHQAQADVCMPQTVRCARLTFAAHMSGVSLRSVKRIAQEEPVVHVDDKAERNKRQTGRPSTVQNSRKQVVGILQPSLEILRPCGRPPAASYVSENPVGYYGA